MNAERTSRREILNPETHAGSERFVGVEGRGAPSYMLRTAQQAHANISALADQKVNILITVSSVILTLAFTRIGDETVRVTLLVLSTFTLTSLVLAVLAILPSFQKMDTSGALPHGFNLLFFGHFARLSEERYMEEMAVVIREDARVYEAQIRDLYQVGAYLYQRKFRYLRASYVILLAGFATAGVVHVVAASLG